MEKGFDIGQAMNEANRCLLCHDAPCSKNCPAGTDPAKFIKKLRFKNITGAIRTVKTNNILGGACGVLCPTARLCEKECVSKGLDKPIQIGRIQRALIEHSWKINFSPLKKGEPNGKKVAVIGAGPAGLACSAQLAKDGFEVAVFDEHASAGGVLGFGVPNHRFDNKFLERELEDLKGLGVRFKFNTPVKTKDAFSDLKKDGYNAVFVGVGLWNATSLKKGAALEGLFTSVDFLEASKSDDKKVKDVVKGRRVAVIGGGSVAIDCAESCLELGASDVYLVYRRAFQQMPAELDERVSAQMSGVQFLLLNQPLDYISKAGRIAGVRLVRTELGPVDATGRRSPVEVKNSEWTLSADVVIEAIGNEPDAMVKEAIPAKFTGRGLLNVSDETLETSMKGVFAGGDIARGPALIVNAIADGKKAAAEIKKFVNGGGSL